MFTETNTIVQALVWTTLAGLLYAVWLHNRSSAEGLDFGLSQQVKSVTNLLRTFWMLLAISVLVSLILFSLPNLLQNVSAAEANCTSGASSGPYPIGTTYYGVHLCVPSDQTTP